MFGFFQASTKADLRFGPLKISLPWLTQEFPEGRGSQQNKKTEAFGKVPKKVVISSPFEYRNMIYDLDSVFCVLEKYLDFHPDPSEMISFIFFKMVGIAT